jgi:hypothetical protein
MTVRVSARPELYDKHPDELSSIKLYDDGQLVVDGHARQNALLHILRMIADSIEAGQTVLTDMRSPG